MVIGESAYLALVKGPSPKMPYWITGMSWATLPSRLVSSLIANGLSPAENSTLSLEGRTAVQIASGALRLGMTRLFSSYGYDVKTLSLINRIASAVATAGIPMLSTWATTEHKRMGFIEGLSSKDILLATAAGIFTPIVQRIMCILTLGSDETSKLLSTQLSHEKSVLALCSAVDVIVAEKLEKGDLTLSEAEKLQALKKCSYSSVTFRVRLACGFLNLFPRSLLGPVGSTEYFLYRSFSASTSGLDTLVSQPLAYAMNRIGVLSSLTPSARLLATSVISRGVAIGIFTVAFQRLAPKVLAEQALKFCVVSLLQLGIDLGVWYTLYNQVEDALAKAE